MLNKDPERLHPGIRLLRYLAGGEEEAAIFLFGYRQLKKIGKGCHNVVLPSLNKLDPPKAKRN